MTNKILRWVLFIPIGIATYYLASILWSIGTLLIDGDFLYILSKSKNSLGGEYIKGSMFIFTLNFFRISISLIASAFILGLREKYSFKIPVTIAGICTTIYVLLVAISYTEVGFNLEWVLYHVVVVLASITSMAILLNTGKQIREKPLIS